MEKSKQTFSIIYKTTGKKRIVDKGYSLKNETPPGYSRTNLPPTIDNSILGKRKSLDGAELNRSDEKQVSPELPSDQVYDPDTMTIVTDPTGNENPLKYQDDRYREYPIVGTQLDAIMKGFKKLSANGVDVGIDIAGWLTACQDVKTKYPKPYTLKEKNV